MDAAIQLSLIEQAAAAKVRQRKNVRFAAKLPAAPQDRQKQPRGTYLLCTPSSTSSEDSRSGSVASALCVQFAPEVRLHAAGAAKSVPQAIAMPARSPAAGASIAAAKEMTQLQAPRAAASKRIRQRQGKEEATERTQTAATVEQDTRQGTGTTVPSRTHSQCISRADCAANRGVPEDFSSYQRVAAGLQRTQTPEQMFLTASAGACAPPPANPGAMLSGVPIASTARST